MKALPVYTILWVVSFLVKASFSFPPNLHNDADNHFKAEPKADQMTAISSDMEQIREKREARKNETESDASKATNTSLINTTTTTTTKTSYVTPSTKTSYVTPSTKTSYVTSSTKTSYVTPSTKTSYVTPSTKTSYVAPSTNDTENVTQFDIQTPSMNASEKTSTQYPTTTPVITTTTQAALNEYCKRNESCENEHAVCKDQTCVCQEDYFEDESECKKKAALNETCERNESCKNEFAVCKDRSCVCQEDYFEDESECKKKATFNEYCERNESCKNKFTFCINHKCACQEDYYRSPTGCQKKLAYGESCVYPQECMDKKAYCIDQKCECYHVYYRKNGECIDKIRFGKTCEVGDKCSDDHAVCSTETKQCVCSDRYTKKMNKCAKITVPYLWIAIIILIILLLVSAFIYFYFFKYKQTTGKVNFLKLKPFKTLSHKRPYKIKNFIHMDSKTFIQDYKVIGKVNPFILTEESDHSSNDTFLPCYEAQKLENKKKNRFLNVLPFDHSRVKLETVDDDPFTDYINANYITGYNQEKEYIACQGPLIHTVDDFWRMVWQENINLIVMLTLCEENGKHKCYPYWPKKEKLKVISRDLLLETDVVVSHEYYSESSILVNMDEETRIIKHLHFKKWPDFSATVDPTVLINFVKIIRSHFSQAPILVHCSAGVGRTGTLIAVDYMMQYVRDHTLDDSVDIFSFVYKMRENRPQMVQNQDQYVLINTCVKRAITDKFHLKITPVIKEEENKKKEIKVDVEEGGDTEKDTETDDSDDLDDVDAKIEIITKVDGKEDDSKEPTVKVEANGAAASANVVEKAAKDATETAVIEKDATETAVVEKDATETAVTEKDATEDDGIDVDEAKGDAGEDKDANSNMYSNDYEEDDERAPLTQVTSEL